MKGKFQLLGGLLGFGLWVAGAVAGLLLLVRFQFAPGAAGTAPARLPAELRGMATVPSLWLALHPRCPCSRASLAELAKIFTRVPGACRPVLLVFKPADQPDGWTESGLLAQARRLGMELRMDPDGTMARRLGLLTSGEVALYGADGDLRFHGGVTAGRGHEGDNAGQSTVERILRGEAVPVTRLPAFGCPLAKRQEGSGNP